MRLRKFLRVTGIVLGLALLVALLALGAIYYITETKLNTVYDYPIITVAIPSDRSSVERGQHLAISILLCSECHGKNFSGAIFDNGPLLGRLRISNLTPGKGGVGDVFSDQDWVRAIRYGIARNGKSLIGMPSYTFHFLSDEDLGAVIAYLKSLPPHDNDMPPSRLGPIGRIFLLQDPTLLPAAIIDPNIPIPIAPAPGITVEYGSYLANACKFCHGEDLSGGSSQGSGVNLTPGGDLGNWREADFITAIRTGFKPDGKKLDPQNMPWKSLGQMKDEELKAIWMYLQTIPAVENTPTAGP